MSVLKQPYYSATGDPMESVAVRKTEELDPALKSSLESLFGRRLEHGEAVTFISVPAHPAPPEAVRREALARLEVIMDKAAENAKDIPEEELDTAVDEAMDHVRKWRE